MESENKIIVRVCRRVCSYSVDERNILQTVLPLFFFSVHFLFFSMPSRLIITVIQFMFLGINIFEMALRAHFNPRLTAWAKMSLSRAQNIFMPADIHYIVLVLMSSTQS